jgi:hypothetical protein
LKLCNGAAELLPGLGEGETLLEGPLRNAERDGCGTHPLTVVGIHQLSKAAPPTSWWLQHHARRNLEILEDHFGLRNAAKAHGGLSLANAKALCVGCLCLVANKDKTTDAQLPSSFIKNPGEDQSSFDTPPPVIQCFRPFST